MSHRPDLIRNVAIIAHVDHGKTTLVDELFKQSGTFRDNETVVERMMDSMDLERERGITIRAKNGALRYAGHTLNIIDTPGHADFGGEVERTLQMADGALLLVDAQEGPMPQTYFVLKKALNRHLPIVVVINKIDKPAARPHWAVDQIFDLLVSLNASHAILDFHVVFASAREGHASLDPAVPGSDMKPVFDAILQYIPAPSGDGDAPFQLQVASIDHSSFLGRLGIGKITAGRAVTNMAVVLAKASGGAMQAARITKIYRYDRDRKVETDRAGVGDIVAVAGLEDVMVGDTYTDPEQPTPLPPLPVDPPTVSMNFLPNSSPFAGQEGTYCTSAHLAERLRREALSDVALHVEELQGRPGFKVAGRGELHLSIKLEQMRREGYEVQVSSPQVILREENGRQMEPYEELTLDVPESSAGTVIEKLGRRKGQMQEMRQDGGMTRLRYIIPTRGLLGFRSEFLSDTKGMGVLNYVFHGYGPYVGEMRNRNHGVLVSRETCTTVAYALFNLQERGRLFLGPGERVYRGQVIGEHCRSNDLDVNPAKGKKLTNIRAAGSDENVILTPPVRLSLEDCIAFINDDELVEVTPKSVRLRKAPPTLNA